MQVSRYRVVLVVTQSHLPQPFPHNRNRLVPTADQLSLDRLLRSGLAAVHRITIWPKSGKIMSFVTADSVQVARGLATSVDWRF